MYGTLVIAICSLKDTIEITLKVYKLSLNSCGYNTS